MTAVIPLNSRTILGLNQEAYQQLRLALSLNLRRQLLIAVCDDTALQNELATRLEEDLGSPTVDAEPVEPAAPAVVNLWLDIQNPDLARQVVMWCKQHGINKAQAAAMPTFQILGIDRLTRHAPAVQNRFLASLAHLEPLLSRLELRLVLWVSRPWLRKIRQSVPEAWQLRNGLFEFAGDPAPLTPANSVDLPLRPARPTAAAPKASQKTSQIQPKGAQTAPATADLTAQVANFWTVLTEDLDALEQPTAPVEQKAEQKAEKSTDSRSQSQAAPTRQAPLQAPPAALTPPLTDHSYKDPDTNADSVRLHSSELQLTELNLADLNAAEFNPADSGSANVDPAQNPGAPIAVETPADTPSPVADDETQPEPTAAIADGQLMALWQHVQSLANQQAGPLTLARAYLFLGQTCRDRIEAGSSSPDLMSLAIEAYRQALPGLSAGSPDWCDGFNDLGSLYWLRSHSEPQPEAIAHWLLQSVQAYRQVLDHPQSQPSAEGLARLCSNLGTVHSLLANLQEPNYHLEQAVRAYHRALQQRPAEAYPLEYASLQNSLGAIHWRLAQQGNARSHLHRAITAYSEALKYRSAQVAPQEFAMIQNNLGIAYWSLAQHERPVFLLEQAVAAYQSALAYRTLTTDAAGCAATQNNLGTAYWDLAQHHTGSQQQSLWRQSLSAYETALDAARRSLSQSPPVPLSFDLWATFHSAGVVHDQLAQHTTEERLEARCNHLDQALLHYLSALEGWRSLPDRMALLKTALVHNVRLQYQLRGLEGQTAVLSKIPGELLPDILPQL